MLSDQQLLHEYAKAKNERAFQEIVSRYVDAVYSAANRMVKDKVTAEDVTQGVFLALSKDAGRLATHPLLPGWLHRTTRNVASNIIRAEARRRMSEKELALMDNPLTASNEESWKIIAPILDEGIDQLSDLDRKVVLLRFFQKLSAREIGKAIGVNEAAAQKRLNRAVERLREFFKARGVTLEAKAIFANAYYFFVQSAPIGLEASITKSATVAAIAMTGSASLPASKIAAMTTLKKLTLGTVCAGLLSTSVYQKYNASRLENQLHSLRQAGDSGAEINRLRLALAEKEKELNGLFVDYNHLKNTSAEIHPLRAELTRLRGRAQGPAVSQPAPSEAPLLLNAKNWLSKVDKLQSWLAQHPEKWIPEMDYLTEDNWLNAVKHTTMEGDHAAANAVYDLHETAKNEFAHQMQNALKDYLQANGGNLPTDIEMLKNYFKPELTSEIANRYVISTLPDAKANQWVIIELPSKEDPEGLVRVITTNDWRKIRIK